MSNSGEPRAGLRTRVFIVGAGPVGLSMALLLGRLDVDFVVVEKSPGTTDHPKARSCDIRTMELFRRWGVEAKIRERGLPLGSDTTAFVETIAGREYGRTRPEPDSGLSPGRRCLVAQDAVEEVLLSTVRGLQHGRVFFETEFVGFTSSETGVTVTVKDLRSGASYEWSADYLIGADGASSSVRRLTDIQMRGPATLAVMANEYWSADLSHIPRIAVTAGYRVSPNATNGIPWSVLNTNGKDRWLSLGRVGAEADERPLPRTDSEVVQLARAQTGIANLDVTVISRSVWRLSRQVASRFSQGRVHLIGDAAHRFPPTGGMGMNTGIQDAHNLAWKLRKVLAGEAPSALLETYDLERRPVAEANADFSLGNYRRYRATDLAFSSGNLDQMNFWIRDTENHVQSSGQSLGFAYEEGAVIPDATAGVAVNSRIYTPSDRPGGRFPHLWTDLTFLESTIDWFDRDFVLVIGPKGDAWQAAAQTISQRMRLRLQTKQLETVDPDRGIFIGPRGATLVRPDGHVAWRMPWLPGNPVEELGDALTRINQGAI